VFYELWDDDARTISDNWGDWKKPEEINKERLLKELCDVLYVTYGFAATFGLNINEAFNRVHASNMSKLGEDGKPIYHDEWGMYEQKLHDMAESLGVLDEYYSIIDLDYDD